jgi:hypothetical protein
MGDLSLDPHDRRWPIGEAWRLRVQTPPDSRSQSRSAGAAAAKHLGMQEIMAQVAATPGLSSR